MQKYYLNKQTNSNRVYIPPKSLNIAWGHDPRYWKWELLEEWEYDVLTPYFISTFILNFLLETKQKYDY